MTHGGGNMAGMVVHWPKGIKAKGEKRRQYASLIDIAPTILEAIGIPEPKIVNGHEQTPMAGVSMQYSFDEAKAKGRHVTQYNECKGNRSIYHDGWLAAVVHRAPWEHTPRVDDFVQGQMGAYHMDEDFGLANDLAAKEPDKLKEMQDLFLAEAIKYNVLPLDDRSFETLNPVRGRTPGPDVRPQDADALPGHDGHDRERLHQHQGRVVHDRRRVGNPQRWRRRRDSFPGWTGRRLEPLREERQAEILLQLARAGECTRSRATNPCPQGRST